jgi:hypothetical protein
MDFMVGFIAATVAGSFVILGAGATYLYFELKKIKHDIYEVELEIYGGGFPDDDGGLDIPEPRPEKSEEDSKILAFTRTGKKSA